MTKFLIDIPEESVLTSDEAKFIEKYYVKQGEWIRKTDGLPHFVTLEWFICSECGVQKSESTPFCPNCGARMKEGEKG